MPNLVRRAPSRRPSSRLVNTMNGERLFDDLFNKSSDSQLNLTNRKTYSRRFMNGSSLDRSPEVVELMEVDKSDDDEASNHNRTIAEADAYEFLSDSNSDLEDEIIPSPLRRKALEASKKSRQISKSAQNVSSKPPSPSPLRRTPLKEARDVVMTSRIIIPDSGSESESQETATHTSQSSDNNGSQQQESTGTDTSKCGSYKTDPSIRLPEIDQNSIRSLEPGRMLNDTIIEFYMNHRLKEKTQTQRNRFHLFNTFIYNKLKAMHRQTSIKPGESSENCFRQTIRRWYKNVRLFDKDFLVIPICDLQHWVLIIVCFAHKAPAHDEPMVISGNRVGSSEEPCILIFDSLGFKQMSKFTEPIRSFLDERWRFERPNEELRNFKDRISFRDIQAKVPRQRNTYDCGIHLLVSFERFLDCPIHFYEKIKAGQDVTQEFRESDMRLKRHKIRSLLPNYNS